MIICPICQRSIALRPAVDVETAGPVQLTNQSYVVCLTCNSLLRFNNGLLRRVDAGEDVPDHIAKHAAEVIRANRQAQAGDLN